MQLALEQALRRAEKLASDGKLSSAHDIYTQILNKFPDSNVAQQGLSKISSLEKKNSKIDPALINKLFQLYSAGDFKTVVNQCKELLETSPQEFDLLNIIAASHLKINQINQATEYYKRALAASPKSAETHNNIGLALKSSGKPQEAETHFLNAIELNKNYAQAYSNLALLHWEQGKSESAIKGWQKAIEHNENFTDAIINLGNAWKETGQLPEAMHAYNKALKLSPNDDRVLVNLGLVHKKQGKLQKAVDCYQQAITHNPQNAQAYNNLGTILYEEGYIKDSIKHFRLALSIEPNREDFWKNISNPMCDAFMDKYSPEIASIYLKLLDKKTIVRPNQIARSTLGFLKLSPDFSNMLSSYNTTFNQQTVKDFCIKLSQTPLFLTLLRLGPIPDMEVEAFLKNIRRSILLNIETVSDISDCQPFITALALQCFINEYIYGETEEETLSIDRLAKTITRHNIEENSFAITCLASYRPIHKYDWAVELGSIQSLRKIYDQQVSEVLTENEIKRTIKRLTDIEDETSCLVKNQYEENPYPRWVQTSIPVETFSVNETLRKLELDLAEHTPFSSNKIDILVAGCGTGQHAINTATRFPDSKVCAIDLSLTSLGYAIRKSKELGITNIEYMQADILNLAPFERQFDLIESVGVLHHLADPFSGFTQLYNCLKSKGLMRLGLYSEKARKHISEAREIIEKKYQNSHTSNILEFRQDVIQGKYPTLKKLFSSADFFSTSDLRDLIFHEQEHRYTFPRLTNEIGALDLKFLGFELPHQNIKKAFKQTYPEARALYDLKLWEEFEELNPSTFSQMYQFWVQK